MLFYANGYYTMSISTIRARTESRVRYRLGSSDKSELNKNYTIRFGMLNTWRTRPIGIFEFGSWTSQYAYCLYNEKIENTWISDIHLSDVQSRLWLVDTAIAFRTHISPTFSLVLARFQYLSKPCPVRPYPRPWSISHRCVGCLFAYLFDCTLKICIIIVDFILR